MNLHKNEEFNTFLGFLVEHNFDKVFEFRYNHNHSNLHLYAVCETLETEKLFLSIESLPNSDALGYNFVAPSSSFLMQRLRAEVVELYKEEDVPEHLVISYYNLGLDCSGNAVMPAIQVMLNRIKERFPELENESLTLMLGAIIFIDEFIVNRGTIGFVLSVLMEKEKERIFNKAYSIMQNHNVSNVDTLLTMCTRNPENDIIDNLYDLDSETIKALNA